MRRRRAAAAAALMLAVAAATASCSSGDERAIRDQLSKIADALTAPADEGDLARVARLAALRNTLAPGIRIETGATAMPGAPIPAEIVGRDTAAGIANRIPRGVVVEFVDLQVTIDASRSAAQVYCTAKITSDAPQQPAVDARELTVAFSKIDGAWLVTSVRPEQTLIR